MGEFSLFLRQKMKLFAVKFREILEVFSVQALQKVHSALSRFLHPKMKLFAVEFRRILEVFSLWGL